MDANLLSMTCGFGSCLMLFYVATLLSVACKESQQLGKRKVEYWFWTPLYYAAILLAILCAVVGVRGLIPVLLG